MRTLMFLTIALALMCSVADAAPKKPRPPPAPKVPPVTMTDVMFAVDAFKARGGAVTTTQTKLVSGEICVQTYVPVGPDMLLNIFGSACVGPGVYTSRFARGSQYLPMNAKGAKELVENATLLLPPTPTNVALNNAPLE